MLNRDGNWECNSFELDKIIHSQKILQFLNWFSYWIIYTYKLKLVSVCMAQAQINLSLPSELKDALERRAEAEKYESTQALIREILRQKLREELIEYGKFK